MNAPELAVKRPVTIAMATIAVAVFGFLAARTLPVIFDMALGQRAVPAVELGMAADQNAVAYACAANLQRLEHVRVALPG